MSTMSFVDYIRSFLVFLFALHGFIIMYSSKHGSTTRSKGALLKSISFHLDRKSKKVGALVYGTVIVLESNFMYVVANPVHFHGRPGYILSIRCPGGLELHYPKPVIHLTENIAGICCPYTDESDISSMRAIPLSRKDIAETQPVHVYSPLQMLITSGSVMGIRGQTFQNSCSAGFHTAFGAPVVADNGRMVGMCNDFRDDYLEAISTATISLEIERAQSRDFKSIRHMLRHLRNLNKRI